jgi:putative Mn2+ efflux pump MntP
MGQFDISSILLIAVGVAMDCFAVALGGSISMRRLSHRQVMRASGSFGVFQGGMLALGWLAGFTVERFISGYDHWVAFSLLTLVGGRIIWDAVKKRRTQEESIDVTKGLALLVLSIATSIDALAVGLGLALLKSSIMVSSLVVGSVTFLVAAGGFYIGKRATGLLGRQAKIVGGLLLIGIGLRILLTHIYGS